MSLLKLTAPFSEASVKTAGSISYTHITQPFQTIPSQGRIMMELLFPPHSPAITSMVCSSIQRRAGMRG